MSDEEKYVCAFMVFWAALFVTLIVLIHSADAHDHQPGETPEQAKVYEFYSRWNRPKGNFQGMMHRAASCCNRRDCFPVAEARVQGGKLWIRVQYENGDVSQEYSVDPAVIESNQEDPRESPDARSHACIIGGIVACFVEGGGV